MRMPPLPLPHSVLAMLQFEQIRRRWLRELRLVCPICCISFGPFLHESNLSWKQFFYVYNIASPHHLLCIEICETMEKECETVEKNIKTIDKSITTRISKHIWMIQISNWSLWHRVAFMCGSRLHILVPPKWVPLWPKRVQLRPLTAREGQSRYMCSRCKF